MHAVGVVRIVHSVLGGSRTCSPWKFRPYESASEAVGDHHNHAKFMATGMLLK